MRTPVATYRIQLTPGSGFAALRDALPWIESLGVSDLYLSPIFEARPGSSHGYDVTDPTRIREALGGEAGFLALAREARGRGLGILLDIVPNHMAAAWENPWWRDVLELGEASDHAGFFDIDWARRDGRVVLPFLGDELPAVLERGELTLGERDGEPAALYFEHAWPLAPGTEEGAPGEVLERQRWTLVPWREAAAKINYRRFFTITDLVGVRVEDPAVFEAQRERVFARTWHWVADADRLRAPGHALPVTHVEGSLDEPLVLIRAEDGGLRCLSNVCTHRGALVAEGEGHVKSLKCRYHGRRYDLEGRCTFMPEFDDVAGFPSERDHLPSVPVAEWGPLVFAALDPAMPFGEWIGPVEERTAGMPVERAVYDPSSSGDYLIEANWALYCDNYLEEFHIPYVHGGSLTGALDYEAYRTDRFAWGNVQVGPAKGGQPVLPLGAGTPDHGQRIAGYYFWLFPATMLNFYPWGLSLNVVRPLGPGRTRVSFRSYVWDAAGFRYDGDPRVIQVHSLYPREAMPLWDKVSTRATILSL